MRPIPAAPSVDDPASIAAQHLWRCWQAGETIDVLPSSCRPVDRAAGYAVQAALPVVSGRALYGWKIAATSTAGQAHIAVSGPLAGRLLDGQVAADGASLSLAGNRMRVAEAEFAFRFARALPPRGEVYGVDEVLDAVATLHPSIELPDSRYADFVRAGEPQLLADNACAGQFVLGPACATDWRALDLAAHRTMGRVLRSGSIVLEREGCGTNVLGDPRIALAWLVNELSGLGLTLEPGQVVTTGTCLVPLAIAPGDEVRVDFGELGRVSVRCAG